VSAIVENKVAPVYIVTNDVIVTIVKISLELVNAVFPASQTLPSKK